ncbi:MAG TPA: OB-fold nucleic acid binding domain-containing protein, partial [Corynebacterium sp.]|nr:OB-fold nucleic acid binding domain-containing protein [Corynebacterium sp.]
ISAVDRRFSKRDGSPWAIVTVEDHNGAQVELLVFNKVYSLVSSSIVEDNIILAKAHVSIRDDRMSLFCDDLKVPELGPGNGAGLPLRLTMRTDQCTMDTIAKLKEVLVRNAGDSDVYLKLVNGEDSTMMILGEHLRVDRSGSLMGDLKATMGAGILG